jgi:hypothetical protein
MCSFTRKKLHLQFNDIKGKDVCKTKRILEMSMPKIEVHLSMLFTAASISQLRIQNMVKVKVKVKLSLCLTKHHAMKTYWGSGGIAPHIL